MSSAGYTGLVRVRGFAIRSVIARAFGLVPDTVAVSAGEIMAREPKLSASLRAYGDTLMHVIDEDASPASLAVHATAKAWMEHEHNRWKSANDRWPDLRWWKR